jgi:WD40 repeat protein
VYTGNFDAEAGLFDSETGALLVDFTATDYFTLGAAFTPDGSELIVMGSAVYVLDVETLLSGAPIEDAVKFEFPGLDTFAQSVSVSPDGAMLAAAGRSDPLKVWDLATGELLDEFGGKVAEGFHVGTFHPSLPHLIVTTPPNEIRIHTFDIEELVALGRASLSREMTEEECQAYFRRACSES